MLTTIFGLGLLKPAPGTYGSILAFLIYFLPPEIYLYINLFLIVITFISYISINRMEKLYGNDPSIIIIDEFIAMSLIITTGLIPSNFIIALSSLIIFRVYDIFKPFPINLINRNTGSFYVLFDDIVAAILTIITLNLLIYLNNLLLIFEIIQKF